MRPIPMPDDVESRTMRHRPTTDDRRIDPDSANEAVDRHLTAALEATEQSEVRYHLREGLQLLKALDAGRH